MKTFQTEWQSIKNFCESAEYKQEIKSAKEKLLAKPLVLYGAGAEGLEFATVLEFCGIKPACFCDTNKVGVDKSTGLSIISPKDLLNDYKNANILISSSGYTAEIQAVLEAHNVPAERILPRSLWFRLCLLTAGEPSADTLRGSYYLALFNAVAEMLTGNNDVLLSGYKRTYDLVQDNESKQVLMDIIRFCLTGNQISRNPLDTVYFDNDIIKLSPSEVFADVGMFTADTAEDFFKNTHNKYTHYYGFEPDSATLEKARLFLANRSNTTTEGKGVWSCETTLYFSEQHINENAACTNENVIEVISLDNYFAKKPHIPTFIKMDIEGSELEALKGAECIIRDHKPKLAICIYHRPEDIYTLPEIIKSFRDDYKFYIRHYTNNMCDTVLYAV